MRDFRGLGSEYSEIHKVHTLHAVSALVNVVKFALRRIVVVWNCVRLRVDRIRGRHSYLLALLEGFGQPELVLDFILLGLSFWSFGWVFTGYGDGNSCTCGTLRFVGVFTGFGHGHPCTRGTVRLRLPRVMGTIIPSPVAPLVYVFHGLRGRSPMHPWHPSFR